MGWYGSWLHPSPAGTCRGCSKENLFLLHQVPLGNGPFPAFPLLLVIPGGNIPGGNTVIKPKSSCPQPTRLRPSSLLTPRSCVPPGYLLPNTPACRESICVKGEMQNPLSDHFSNFTDDFKEIPLLLFWLCLFAPPWRSPAFALPPPGTAQFQSSPQRRVRVQSTRCTSAFRYLVACCDV